MNKLYFTLLLITTQLSYISSAGSCSGSCSSDNCGTSCKVTGSTYSCCDYYSSTCITSGPAFCGTNCGGSGVNIACPNTTTCASGSGGFWDSTRLTCRCFLGFIYNSTTRSCRGSYSK